MSAPKAKPNATLQVLLPVPTVALLMQLHHVLDALEQDGQLHIASWQLHGRSFKIHNHQDFKTVLPR
jgi:hypothetical protein